MKSTLTDGETRAYAAGIFDGEGSIYISAVKDNRKDYTHYSLRVEVSNTERRLIEWFKNMFGGRIREKTRKNPKHKTCYDWILVDKSVESFIRIVYPYLLVKLDRVRIALTFLSCKDTVGGESFYNQMKALNKKGV